MVAANKGRCYGRNVDGKVKTCVQIGGIIVIYLYYIIMGALCKRYRFRGRHGVTAVMFIPHADGMPLLLTIVGWVVTLVTIYSGYDYLKKNWDLIKDGASKGKSKTAYCFSLRGALRCTSFLFPLVREQDKCENILILKDFSTLNRYSFKVCKRTHPALCKLYRGK